MLRRRFFPLTIRIGESGDYTGREAGGARPARSIAGAGGAQTERGSTGCRPLPFTEKEVAAAIRAGGLCSFQPEIFSGLACRTLRLLAGDSSISLRMASRSSV